MRVRFIAAGKNLRLTVGNEYEVQHATTTRYHVINDSNAIQPYDVRLFEVIEEGANAAPAEEAPVRRGPGRPRTTAQQPEAPRETAAQRREREAREEQQHQEAARVAEERRRGRVLTEQDRIATLTVSVNRTGNDIDSASAGCNTSVIVGYDARERLNDDPQLRTISSTITAYKMNNFSCGIKTIVGVENFISTISQLPDYQESDFELLRDAAVAVALNAALADINTGLRTAMTICSVTNRNNYSEHLVNAGFAVSVEPVRNPNSANHINLMVKMH